MGIPLPPKLLQTRKTYPKRSNKETGFGEFHGGGGRDHSELTSFHYLNGNINKTLTNK
jgi:hypothetical protein